jgi:sugar phosphate isomerase/epimerase
VRYDGAMPVTRRDFLAAASAAALPAFARTLPVIGVQLYTVRSILPKDPAAVLGALDKIGYREAEVVAAGADAMWPALKATKLKPVSFHLDAALFTRNREKLPAALEDAVKRGFQYVVCPYIVPADRGGPEVIKKLGETLNEAGRICNKAGIKLCYHNHAFEFEPSGSGNLLDILMQTTDPKLVGLEFDIMWAQLGGSGPAKVLQQYGSRIPLMHLKNVSGGIGPQYNEKVPKEAFREVGDGSIDIPQVLRAAAKAGVKHYFVEQDQTPGDPLESLRKSFEYLHKLNY